MGVGMENEALFGGGDETGLVAEFVSFVGFAFADADGIGFMEAIEFVFVMTFLVVQPLALF